MRISNLEQPPGFFRGLPRLYRDADVHCRPVHLAAQLRRQKIAAQRSHRVVYPSVLGRRVPPEVLV
jgi:hypothetical protein